MLIGLQLLNYFRCILQGIVTQDHSGSVGFMGFRIEIISIESKSVHISTISIHKSAIVRLHHSNTPESFDALTSDNYPFTRLWD